MRKNFIVVLTFSLAFSLGLSFGVIYGRRDFRSVLEKGNLTTEEIDKVVRDSPKILSELKIADDELGLNLAILYKLNITGEEKRGRARLKEMLEHYYNKISSDPSPSERRKVIIEKVKVLLEKNHDDDGAAGP